MNAILGTIGSLLLGATVATVTVVGLVNSQQGAPDNSPANVNQPVVDYGTSTNTGSTNG